MIDAQPGDGWIVPPRGGRALLDDPRAAEAALARRPSRCATGAPTPAPRPVGSAPPGYGLRDPASSRKAAARLLRRGREALAGSGAPAAVRGTRSPSSPNATSRAAGVPADDLLDDAPGGARHGSRRPRMPLNRRPVSDDPDQPDGCAPTRPLRLAGTAPGGRTHALTDAWTSSDLTRAALPADVAAGLGPGAHRQPGGAVAAARRSAAREPMHPEIDPLYDAFEHPRVERPDAAAAAAGRGPRATRTRCAAGSSTCSPASALGRAGPAAGRGGLRVRHDRPARAAARRDHADHPPAARAARRC